MTDNAAGLIIAAPSSGSGKTVVTLGLLRQFARTGVAVSSAKVGPDYIDPAFHAIATVRPCRNLDTWAMRPATLSSAIETLADDGPIVCEGVMGLFDGARGVSGEADGSSAALSRLTGWPVVLVVDASAQAASAAAVVRGFATHDAEVPIAGVIFNRVGSDAHAAILIEATAAAFPNLPVLGCLPRLEGMNLPERHLGLVQAIEHPDLPGFMDCAADWVAAHLDLDRLQNLFTPAHTADNDGALAPPLPPLGQRIAVAQDRAFAFAYPHILDGWRRAGAEILTFSPLDDGTPDADADAVYLPGGYPELDAGTLAQAVAFRAGMAGAAERGAAIFGECGGYMVLGEALTDADGTVHRMLGLLPVETSFQDRRLHLGYRQLKLKSECALGDVGACYRGHEFHYATVVRESGAQPLFAAANSAGALLDDMGLVQGRVSGSFAHLIDHVVKD